MRFKYHCIISCGSYLLGKLRYLCRHLAVSSVTSRPYAYSQILHKRKIPMCCTWQLQLTDLYIVTQHLNVFTYLIIYFYSTYSISLNWFMHTKYSGCNIILKSFIYQTKYIGQFVHFYYRTTIKMTLVSSDVKQCDGSLWLQLCRH